MGTDRLGGQPPPPAAAENKGKRKETERFKDLGATPPAPTASRRASPQSWTTWPRILAGVGRRSGKAVGENRPSVVPQNPVRGRRPGALSLTRRPPLRRKGGAGSTLTDTAVSRRGQSAVAAGARRSPVEWGERKRRKRRRGAGPVTRGRRADRGPWGRRESVGEDESSSDSSFREASSSRGGGIQ